MVGYPVLVFLFLAAGLFLQTGETPTNVMMIIFLFLMTFIVGFFHFCLLWLFGLPRGKAWITEVLLKALCWFFVTVVVDCVLLPSVRERVVLYAGSGAVLLILLLINEQLGRGFRRRRRAT